MIRSYPDYIQKGHIYFQNPSLRREAFDFLEQQINDKVNEKNAQGTASLLSELKRFLEKSPNLSLKCVDEGLAQEAQEFFIRNVESLLRLCALANDFWERFHTLYLIARFLPQLEEQRGILKNNHLIQGYLLFIHTLSHPELYLKDKEGSENRGCFALAIKGLYRWDGRKIIQKWNRMPDIINAIITDLPGENKSLYEPIVLQAQRVAERVMHGKEKPEDLLFLCFTSIGITAVRLKILKEKKRDLLHEIWTRKQRDVLENARGNLTRIFPEDSSNLAGEIEAFMAGRLGGVWSSEEALRKPGEEIMSSTSITLEPFSQISTSSGEESFSEEDLAIIRKLSKTGPNSS